MQECYSKTMYLSISYDVPSLFYELFITFIHVVTDAIAL